jgi:septation ring formation regulator EzrA
MPEEKTKTKYMKVKELYDSGERDVTTICELSGLKQTYVEKKIKEINERVERRKQ